MIGEGDMIKKSALTTDIIAYEDLISRPNLLISTIEFFCLRSFQAVEEYRNDL